jgi:hypothetical protein
MVIVADDARRKITVALKPRAVRTPCSAPHCVIKAVLAAFASSGFVAMSRRLTGAMPINV